MSFLKNCCGNKSDNSDDNQTGKKSGKKPQKALRLQMNDDNDN